YQLPRSVSGLSRPAVGGWLSQGDAPGARPSAPGLPRVISGGGDLSGALTPRAACPSAHRGASCGSTAPTAPAALTARQLSYLLVRRPSDRTAEEQEHVAQGQQHDPIMAQVTTLTEDF